jgi:hypothetical protein
MLRAVLQRAALRAAEGSILGGSSPVGAAR